MARGFEQSYTLFDIPLSVRIEAPIGASHLETILGDLCAEPSRITGEPVLELTVQTQDATTPQNFTGRPVFVGDGLTIRESETEIRITDGDSVMIVEPVRHCCRVWLDASFQLRPTLLQRNFWAFAIAKLLRSVGLYTLHAAGLVSPGGTPVLIIAKSGSGKSTLAIGLLRAGWRILSDDALVIRESPGGIETLALRKHLYIDGTDAERYGAFTLTPAQSDRAGGARFRLAPGKANFGRVSSPVNPEVLIFPSIVRTPSSTMHRIAPADTIGRLLEASGPQTLDRACMEPHLRILSRLTRQAVSIDLRSGEDLHSHPQSLEELLAREGLLGERERVEPERATS